MKKKIIIGILILLLLVVLTFVGITAFSRITKITIAGDDYYTEAELKEKIFYDEKSYSPLIAFIRNFTGKKAEIPFIKDYSLSFNDLSSVTVTVYPKVMVGYAQFLDSNLYFDREGLVVESSSVVYPEVPLVSGLDINYVVLGQQLPVKSETVLNKLLQISQFICDRVIIWDGQETALIDITDRIHFDSSNDVLIYIDEIIVNFGNGSELEGSLKEFADIIPNLYGRKGTLHLESYDSTKENQIFRFY